MPFFNRKNFTRRFGEVYGGVISFIGDVSFVSAATGITGTNVGGGTKITYQHQIPSNITNGYSAFCFQTDIITGVSGAYFNNVPMVQITGTSSIGGRYVQTFGTPLGSISAGTYNVDFYPRAFIGNHSASTFVFDNVNQVAPYSGLISSGAAFSNNRTAFPEANSGDCIFCFGFHQGANIFPNSGLDEGQVSGFDAPTLNLSYKPVSGQAFARVLNRINASTNMYVGAFAIKRNL